MRELEKTKKATGPGTSIWKITVKRVPAGQWEKDERAMKEEVSDMCLLKALW